MMGMLEGSKHPLLTYTLWYTEKRWETLPHALSPPLHPSIHSAVMKVFPLLYVISVTQMVFWCCSPHCVEAFRKSPPPSLPVLLNKRSSLLLVVIFMQHVQTVLHVPCPTFYCFLYVMSYIQFNSNPCSLPNIWQTASQDVNQIYYNKFAWKSKHHTLV